MRSFRLILAAAAVVAAGPGFAQGTEAGVDPAKSREVDDAYRGRCEASAPKELCSCVIAVADSQIDDPVERGVFFDFMMGEVDKAKTTRGMFPPEKNSKFNIKLQKADVMLGSECDRLKPEQPDQAEQQPAQPGQKMP